VLTDSERWGMNFNDLEDLHIWKEAIAIDRKMRNELMPFLKQQREFDLINQMTRSSGAIADNIAEGYGRAGNKEFIQFLSIARGSAFEFRSQVYRCSYRGADKTRLAELNKDTKKLISRIDNLIHHLKCSSLRGKKFDPLPKPDDLE
jgi:four helix bundle protein